MFQQLHPNYICLHRLDKALQLPQELGFLSVGSKVGNQVTLLCLSNLNWVVLESKPRCFPEPYQVFPCLHLIKLWPHCCCCWLLDTMETTPSFVFVFMSILANQKTSLLNCLRKLKKATCRSQVLVSNRKHPDWKHHEPAWLVHGPGQEGFWLNLPRTSLVPSTERQWHWWMGCLHRAQRILKDNTRPATVCSPRCHLTTHTEVSTAVPPDCRAASLPGLGDSWTHLNTPLWIVWTVE